MKTEARSTQISKAKHPKLENEAPKNSTPVWPFKNTRPMLIQQEVVNAFSPLRGRPGGRPCFGCDQKTENA